MALLAKEHSELWVIANGHLDDPRNAEAIVAPGAADAVALAEPALANRNWPHRVRAGQVLAPEVPADLFGPAANLKDWELVGAPEEGLPGAQRP